MEDNSGLPSSSGNQTGKIRPYAYSPSNGAGRTAVIPTRKRKQNRDGEKAN